MKFSIFFEMQISEPTRPDGVSTTLRPLASPMPHTMRSGATLIKASAILLPAEHRPQCLGALGTVVPKINNPPLSVRLESSGIDRISCDSKEAA